MLGISDGYEELLAKGILWTNRKSSGRNLSNSVQGGNVSLLYERTLSKVPHHGVETLDRDKERKASKTRP